MTEIVLDKPSFDLTLTFSNGFKLKIFCDSTNELDKDDNYYFFTDTEIYAVEMYSQLTIETREIEE